MSVDLLPFYGMALGTLGGLVMALASVVNLRRISEKRYLWVMAVGTLLVFFGFIMQSAFILGQRYTFGVLADYGIALAATLVALVIVALLRRRGKAN